METLKVETEYVIIDKYGQEVITNIRRLRKYKKRSQRSERNRDNTFYLNHTQNSFYQILKYLANVKN